LDYFTIDTVIHFAAQSHVETSFSDALKYTHDNIVGTHTLLECCRMYGKIEKFIHISTDEVYGESMLEENENKKNENSILCPTNPYAATKAAAELIVKSYYHSFKMPIIITRGNNVYGPNQYPEKVIPLFIKLLKENKPITIQGDGTNIRSFLHVNDVSTALQLILDKGIIGEIYNIGGDDSCEYTIDILAKKLIDLIQKTNKYEDWITYIKDRPFNDKRYYISNDKLKKLGWIIQHDFDLGLQELCDQTV
jgi:dTDP-glucose 4,6-dehydratase